jgi:hypothetical protein
LCGCRVRILHDSRPQSQSLVWRLVFGEIKFFLNFTLATG